MDQLNILFLLLPTLFLVLVGGFVTFDRMEGGVPAARWGAGAFICGFSGILLEVARQDFPVITGQLSIPMHWLAITCLVQAFLARHGRKLPWYLVLPLLGAAALTHSLALTGHQVTLRIIVANGTGAMLVGWGLALLRDCTSQRKDRVVLTLLALGGSTYLLRPAVFLLGGLSGGYGGDTSWSAYTQLAYLTSAVTAVVLALTLMFVLALDAFSRREQTALLDPLTKVANRQAFQQWCADPEFTDNITATLMIDIDHFKAINDRHGHAVGDLVLAAIAGRLNENTNSATRLARFGGEEFVVLVSGMDQHAAWHLAQALRAEVALSPVKLADREIPVTVSIGLAQRFPRASIDATLEDADRALYAAKNAGRNCVVLATPQPGRGIRQMIAAISA